MNINRFDTLLGYEKRLPPMRAAKVLQTLEKCHYYEIEDNNEKNRTTIRLSEAEFIVSALQRKNRLENKEYNGKLKYHFWGNKWGYRITKTGYDFALWLISEGLTSFETVQERINAETAEKVFYCCKI